MGRIPILVASDTARAVIDMLACGAPDFGVPQGTAPFPDLGSPKAPMQSLATHRVLEAKGDAVLGDAWPSQARTTCAR